MTKTKPKLLTIALIRRITTLSAVTGGFRAAKIEAIEIKQRADR
jgi:hypothetical protein